MRMMFAYLRSVKALQRVCDHVSKFFEEYGLKVSENKSKVICIHGIRGIRRLKIGGTAIDIRDDTQESIVFTHN